MPAAVETRDLTKSFGTFRAVDRLTLSVEEGEIFGFLGSNGAGKSTAIRMLCGLLAPTSGSARVLGIDVAEDPDGVKRRIGYMSQRFSLYEDLTPRQNLRFFGGVYGLRGEALGEREGWALRMSGLGGMEDRLTRELPGGWKQRLALACAVLHRPKVLFLDEPTGGVDPVSRRQFWTLIGEMAAEGVTAFVTTHYLDEAEYCDRLALMHAGRLLASGPLSRLRDVFAGRGVVEVACARPAEALAALTRRGWVLDGSLFGTKIHLVVGDAQAGPRLALAALEEEGFLPAAAEPIVPTLEDVFIHHIGEAERRAGHEGGDAPP